MKNEIMFLSSESMIPARSKNNLTVIIDGYLIATVEQFIDCVEKEFQFPRSCEHGLNRMSDWITDLTWLDYDSYTILIRHYSYLMRESYNWKCIVMRCFQKSILPFWEKDVVNCMVGGKAKSFQVYIVEEC